jgi:hypothetical protein
MKHFRLILSGLLILGLSGSARSGPVLPAITLQPVLTGLRGERPVWLCAAPDDSGRRFVVYQAGRILMVKPGSVGSEA